MSFACSVETQKNSTQVNMNQRTQSLRQLGLGEFLIQSVQFSLHPDLLGSAERWSWPDRYPADPVEELYR